MISETPNTATPPINAGTVAVGLAAGGLVAFGAFVLTHSPDLLAQAAWVYATSLLLVTSPPRGRRALFALSLTLLVALVSIVQDALGHEASAATAVAQIAGVWSAYVVVKLAGIGRRKSPREDGQAAPGLSPRMA